MRVTGIVLNVWGGSTSHEGRTGPGRSLSSPSSAPSSTPSSRWWRGGSARCWPSSPTAAGWRRCCWGPSPSPTPCWPSSTCCPGLPLDGGHAPGGRRLEGARGPARGHRRRGLGRARVLAVVVFSRPSCRGCWAGRRRSPTWSGPGWSGRCCGRAPRTPWSTRGSSAGCRRCARGSLQRPAIGVSARATVEEVVRSARAAIDAGATAGPAARPGGRPGHRRRGARGRRRHHGPAAGPRGAPHLAGGRGHRPGPAAAGVAAARTWPGRTCWSAVAGPPGRARRRRRARAACGACCTPATSSPPSPPADPTTRRARNPPGGTPVTTPASPPTGATTRRGPLREGERVQLTDPRGRMHTITLTAGKEFHTHRGKFLHDDLIGRPDGTVVQHRRIAVPGHAPAAGRLRAVDAARRGGGLPQGRRADRADGRRLPRRHGHRGRRRVRGADHVAAARGRRRRAGALLRAAPGLRRRRHAATSRRSSAARTRPGRCGWATWSRRCPAPGCRPTARCWTCSPPGSAWTPSPTPSAPAGCSSATSPPPRSCRGWRRRCATPGAGPNPRRGSRWSAGGTWRASRCARSTG